MTMSNKLERMKELVPLLNEAAKAYYQEAREIMSNFDYDKYYDELLNLEAETGTILTGSPTQQVGYEILSELPKEAHDHPMLSLNKTKEPSEISEFIADQKALISWKLDGLTIVLTYRNHKLYKAVTRGNGEIGEVITNNAKVFQNIPMHISYGGELLIRGEAVIGYSDFEKINQQIPDIDAKYKNPRNLCSGSVRQLNNEITAKRNVYFYAFSLVRAEGIDFENSRANQMEWIRSQGFDVVEYKLVTEVETEDTIAWFENKIKTNDFPSDGLVVLYDDIAYGQSLGATAKFPRDSIAFKWEDEIRNTTLKDIEWSASRTGLINPVAIFEPVELEGTTVSRASVHNISILKNLELGIGDEIQVYKANMIIPQIADNLTRSSNAAIPEVCPVCGGDTAIHHTNDVETLYCENEDCQAKRMKSFTHLVGRNALNMEGLSEATLEKFIAKGFIKEYADLFHLDRYQEEIMELEGFGEKSYENLIQNADKSRKTTLSRVIFGMGIANIGFANAKMICKAYGDDLNAMRAADVESLSSIDGVGEVIAESFIAFFNNKKRAGEFDRLLEELEIKKEQVQEESLYLEGKTFVITGSVIQFANRNELKAWIEARGGKVTGSVTSKTDYLINNDSASSSSKNKKAKDLGVPILTEQEFLELK